MRFIEQHTGACVPHVLHYGITKESPAGSGPFINMEYIEIDSTSEIYEGKLKE